MSIPQTMQRPPESSRNGTDVPPPDGASKRVLLADDERLLHTVLGDVLQGYGYEVLHALDGEQALRIARDDRPDLILMDVMMPVMSGIEALERLREEEETRGIPVVAITADVLGRPREEMLGRGFDGYIPKPFTAGQLLGEIARHVGRNGAPAA